MRAVLGICLIMCLSAAQPALARTGCASDPTKLGVSRTIVIDGSKGPQFGLKFNDTPFLEKGEVVLSFDDGPLRAITKPVLKALAAHCTKATFFLVGRLALGDPRLVKDIARAGHSVGSHTWSHANLQNITPAEAETEIEMGISAVRVALGRPPAAFFRFPYLRHTDKTAAYLQHRKFAAAGIDVDGRDFEADDVPEVMGRLMAELTEKGKGIILMHDIHAVTATYVPLLLDELKQRGFRVVHLTSKAPARSLAKYDARARLEAKHMRLAALQQRRTSQSALLATEMNHAAAMAPSARARPPARSRAADLARPAANPGTGTGNR